MKNFKYLFFFILLGLVVPACVEDTAPEDAYKGTANLVSFSAASAAFSATADGEEYTKTITMRVKGPSVSSLSGDITATVSVNEELSTAIEGVHFELASNQITFSKENDYLGVFPVTMLTEGIVPPLETNPVLVLNVESVSGGNNVIANGKTITINFLYLCYADLEGTYTATNDWCNPSFTVTITPNADGSWNLSSADGGWLSTCTGNAGLWNAGNINVVCGVVEPTDDLDYGSLVIGVITGGTWDEANGVLTLQNREEYFNGGPREWTSTYTRQ